MKLELKITPVDNGYFIKTYDKGEDQRVPLQTLVAVSLDDMFAIIRTLYNPQKGKKDKFMNITIKPNNAGVIIEHDGLMVRGDSLEEAIKEFGDGMYERGYQAHRKGQL